MCAPHPGRSGRRHLRRMSVSGDLILRSDGDGLCPCGRLVLVRLPGRHEPGGAHPVRAPGHAEHDEGVADREDVGQREAGRDREDITEEGEPWVRR